MECDVPCSECYQLEHSLYKHYTSSGVTTRRARSLAACSALCHQLARCETFSYGDAVYSGDNCLLSEMRGGEISVSADLVSDPGWAVYSLAQGGSQRCQQSGGGEDSGQGNMRAEFDNNPSHNLSPFVNFILTGGGNGGGGRCFREERPGVVYYNDVVRDVRTASSLQQCSDLCHQAPYCRSFAFK